MWNESKTSKQKYLWLEEYGKCGCTNVTRRKGDALGYCPVHGNNRVHLIMIPNDGEVRIGYAG